MRDENDEDPRHASPEHAVLTLQLQRDAGAVARLLQAAPQAMVTVDEQGMIGAANPRAEALLEATRSRLAGRRITSFVAPEDREPLLEHLRGALSAAGGPGDLEVRLSGSGGKAALLGLTFLPLPVSSTPGAFVLLRDLTRTREQEDRLRRQETYMAALHETGLSLAESDSLETFLNALIERACEMLGTPHGRAQIVQEDPTLLRTVAASGAFARDVDHEQAAAACIGGSALLANGRVLLNEKDRTPDDEERNEPFVAELAVPMRVGGVAVGALHFAYAQRGRSFTSEHVAVLERLAALASVALAQDRRMLNHRRAVEAAERRMREAEKLMGLGEMLASVAHELRTPLTYVVNNTALERQHLEEMRAKHPELSGELQPLIEQNEASQKGLERMMRMLRDLRPFSTNRTSRRVATDLASLVIEAVRIFRGARGGNLRVELDLESTHRVEVDVDEMTQVVLNLLNNAADAMQDQGRIRVLTRNRDQPPEIRVIDEGPGLAPEAHERLYEPFFTTKRDGTGLGLVISRRIVESHGGKLWHEPAPEGGTTFVVQLELRDGGAS